MLRSEMVRAGDELVGVASGGVRCNGYSLARQVFFEIAGMDISEPAWKGSDRSLGEELLLPSRIYATAMRSLIAETPVHGLAHITGGGIPGNLPRVLPEGLVGVIDGSSWPRPRIFDEIQRLGSVPPEEMEKVFNLGVGMIAVVAQGEGRRATEHLAGVGHEAWVIGRVEQAD